MCKLEQGDRTGGFTCGWSAVKINVDTFSTFKARIAQISCGTEECQCRCYVITLYKLNALPSKILTLLGRSTIVLVSIGDEGCLNKIGRNFNYCMLIRVATKFQLR